MFGEDRQVPRGSVPCWNLLLHFHTAARRTLAAVGTVALVLAVAATAVNQTSTQRRGLGSSLAAADLVALKQRCGAVEPLEESFQLVRQHACDGRRSGAGQILAFEENRLFIYALADMSSGRNSEDAGGSQKGVQRIRRFFLLKPSTFVVEDLVRAPGAERPLILLTTMVVEILQQAKQIIWYYKQRWACEEAGQFLKSRVGLERFRIRRYEAIKRLAILAMLAMGFLTWILLRNKLLTRGLFLFTSRFRRKTEFVCYRLLDGLQEFARLYQLRLGKIA